MDRRGARGGRCERQAFDKTLAGRWQPASSAIGTGGAHQPGQTVLSILLHPAPRRPERETLAYGASAGQRHPILPKWLQRWKRRKGSRAGLLESRVRGAGRPFSELLDVAGGHGLGRVGVALDVALRAVAEPALQLVGIGTGHLGQVEGEGVAQVVGPQRARSDVERRSARRRASGRSARGAG